MDDIEIPQYFICPISLQIMKDPVTTMTGITYDRESIEHWLFKAKNTTCPATKQPLPQDSDLTPNHTVHRLIQSWCSQNASHGIDRFPTPKPPLNKFSVINLIKDLQLPNLQLKTLRKLEVFAAENEMNRKCIVEAGVIKTMVSFIIKCHRNGETTGLEEALSILYLFQTSAAVENDQIIDSLTWVLGLDIENHVTVKNHAVSVLKTIIEKASSPVLERLKPELFEKIINATAEGISQQGIKAALHVMLDACPWGRNRMMMIESGAVFQLVELELGSPEKKTSELILGILFHLCSCADGRAALLSHAGGIAVVTKRILRVSLAADDRAILILSLISKFSGTSMVLQEMLRVGTVSKLCMVLQVDCATYLKDKAKEILRTHSDVWKDSPCIEYFSHLVLCTSAKFRSVIYSVQCSSRVVAVLQAAQIHCSDAATLEREYTILTNPIVMGYPGSGGIGYGPLAVGPRWLAYSGSPVVVSNSGVSVHNISPLLRVSLVLLQMGAWLHTMPKDQAREERPLYHFDPEFEEKVPGLGSDYEVPVYFDEDLNRKTK